MKKNDPKKSTAGKTGGTAASKKKNDKDTEPEIE
jgi:hypothetical protein